MYHDIEFQKRFHKAQAYSDMRRYILVSKPSDMFIGPALENICKSDATYFPGHDVQNTLLYLTTPLNYIDSLQRPIVFKVLNAVSVVNTKVYDLMLEKLCEKEPSVSIHLAKVLQAVFPGLEPDTT